MSYYIQWKDKGVFIKFSETVTFNDIFTIAMTIYEDKASEKLSFQVWDFDSVDDASIDPSLAKTLRIITRAAMSFIPKNKIAIICRIEGLLDFFKEYKRGLKRTAWQFHILESKKAAEDWIRE